MHERGRDRGVHTAGEPADGPSVTDLIGDRVDQGIGDVGGGPGGLEAGDLVEEAREDLLAVRRVQHLGVVLHTGHAALQVLEGRHRRAGGRSGDGESLGRALDGVVVAHPHRLGFRETLMEHAFAVGRQRRATELASAGVGDLAAQRVRHRLEPVADAEHRDVEVEEGGIEVGCVLGVHRRRTARQDDRDRVLLLDLLDRDVVGDHLGVDAGLAHPAGDQLRVLRPEVDDEHRPRALEEILGRGRVRRRSVCHRAESSGRAGARTWSPRPAGADPRCPREILRNRHDCIAEIPQPLVAEHRRPHPGRRVRRADRRARSAGNHQHRHQRCAHHPPIARGHPRRRRPGPEEGHAGRDHLHGPRDRRAPDPVRRAQRPDRAVVPDRRILHRVPARGDRHRRADRDHDLDGLRQVPRAVGHRHQRARRHRRAVRVRGPRPAHPHRPDRVGGDHHQRPVHPRRHRQGRRRSPGRRAGPPRPPRSHRTPAPAPRRLCGRLTVPPRRR
ncbi:cytosine deaminase [Gordonia terrae C-6]|uniref:Cytosine deaminase n=1 Tax=Gordonia terrae C-6 TaxID=1316928 RepID=R7YC06_9ACTN|nr:cytosine deaminase [Gordonia terrae C-6]